MHRPLLNILLPLSLLLTAGPALIAQDLGSQVRQMFERADRAPITKVWEIGRQMSELGEKEDSLARAIQGQLAGAGENARLAAAAALQELTDSTEFGKEIFEALKPVLENGKTESLTAALSLAGRDSFFSRRIQPELRALIHPKVLSDLTEPDVRIAAAKAMWRIGISSEQTEAKKALLDFVGASDRDLRIKGALALAEINAGSDTRVVKILQDIADEPSPEGQLARMHLKLEHQRRSFDATLRQFADQTTQPGKDDEFALLREVMRRVATSHVRGNDIAETEMVEDAARGLLRSLDRHSAYFTSDEFQKFYFDLERDYGGIGAFVNFDKDDIFSIVRPIYSGPAYEAQLRSGDKILEVDGWETSGHTSDEIIAKLKGKPGTKVTIKVYRPGWDEPKEIAIVRREIQVPSVNHEMLPGDVGYVELITFGGKTSEELVAALNELQKRGARSIVLDLRNNTGGYLQSAKEVVELFVPGNKMVVYTEGRVGRRVEYRTEDRAILPDVPLAVLINGYSASASEITAGALQDHGRAVVVGERSYGKGSVQSLLPLVSSPPERFTDANENQKHDEWEPFEDRNGNNRYDIGPRLKLTMAYYYLPSGRRVHKERDSAGKILQPDWGVTPDRELELRDVALKDRWKEAVIYDLLEKDVFRTYIDKYMPTNQSLFVELAEGDRGDPSRYPGFEEFYKSLDTQLPADDVRRWLRYAIRDSVSDLRGKAFPGGRAVGDFQEDAQLQEAIRVVLEKQDQDIREMQAYKDILKIDFAAKDSKDKKLGQK